MMPGEPIVSVVLPAWNAARYIDGALASLSSQTLGEWEALVIDDASDDDTADRIAAAAANDPRIRLLRQKTNAGPAAARNRAIAEARGRFVALLDADDSYAPSRLSDLVDLAERHGAQMTSDNLWLVPEDDPGSARPMIPCAVLDGERALGLAEFIERNVADARYPGLNLGFLKPIFRRDFLEQHGLRYDERVRFAEDFALYVDCFRAGARWWMSSAPTYRYSVRGGSLTQVQTVHDLGVLRTKLAGLIEQAAASGDAGLVQLARRQARVVDRCFHYRAFTDLLKLGRVSEAWTELSGSGRAAALIIEEAGRQLPVIARKATKGGYWRVHSHRNVTEPPTG